MIRPAQPQMPLRTGVFARWLAVLAMVLQGLFFAEHLSASALQDLGGLGPDTRAGFLQLCTGEGGALYDPVSGRVLEKTAAGQTGCPICLSAAVCAFATPEPPLLPPPVLQLLTALDPAALLPFALVAPVTRAGLIRAPPAPSDL